MTKFEALENKRIELYALYKKEINKSIITLLITIILFIIGFSIMSDYETPIIFFLFGFAGLVIFALFLAKAKGYQSKYRTFVKTELVDKLLADHFEDFSFDENAHVDINATKNAGLVRHPDRYHGEDLITGKYKGLGFKVSDLTLEYRQVTRTQHGTTVTYVPYFKGRWYIYKFPKDLGHTLKIVERRSDVNTKGLTKFESEMIEFNRKFSIYSSDQAFFFQLINPYMLERLLLLENAHRGHISYAFIKDELHIAINDNSNSLELAFKKAINQENLIRFENDIKLIKDIVDEFDLDDIKFR